MINRQKGQLTAVNGLMMNRQKVQLTDVQVLRPLGADDERKEGPANMTHTVLRPQGADDEWTEEPTAGHMCSAVT